MQRTHRVILPTIAILASAIAMGGAASHHTTPLYFEPNQGQADPRVRYLARSTATGVTFVGDDGSVTLVSGRDRASVRIAGAAANLRIEAEQPAPGVSNYYLGKRTITGTPHYGRLRVREIRPGVDLLFYGRANQLEYDLLFSPGTNPSALRLLFEGGIAEIAANGDLTMRVGATEFRQHKPVAWQNTPTGRRSVDCRYGIARSGEIRLEVGRYDKALPLTVDPILSYSTFLGGSSSDEPNGIAVDSTGAAYITGQTSSSDFPVTSGYKRTGVDAFVTKLSADGSSLIYSTFIGGGNDDAGRGIAVDSAGNAYVTGDTGSSDFPVTGLKGWRDAFVLKFGPAGTLVYGTLIGGNSEDTAAGIAVDASGSATIAGNTNSTGIATTGAWRTTLAGDRDAFVSKLSPAGAILFTTYLGGASQETARGIALDGSGRAYVTGSTYSSAFPVTANALGATYSGNGDAFVSLVGANGNQLVYSSFLGGTNTDSAAAIALDASGGVYLGGDTQSTDFPVQEGSFATVKPNYSYYDVGFVAKFTLTQGGEVWSPVYATYLGGDGSTTRILAIAVDAAGQAFATGFTQSQGFPTSPGALKGVKTSTTQEIYISQLSAAGDALIYSTLLGGGSDYDPATGIALDGRGGVYICGYTTTSNVPITPGAYQTRYPKTSSGYSYRTPVVAKLDISSPTQCNPQVTPSSANVAGRGESVAFNLTLAPGCPWEALPGSSIRMNGSTMGMGSASVIPFSATVLPNDSTYSSRTDTIRLGAATFTVNQSAWSCTDPVLTPTSLAFDPAGAIRTISVSMPSGCSWTVTPSAPWINVTSKLSGSGPTTITVYVSPNNFAARSGNITVAGQSIPITQSGEGCTATAAATPTQVGPGGGTGTVRITTTSTCNWTTHSLTPWIQLNSAFSSGQGSGTIPFSVAANPGSAGRTGAILIGDQTVNITQGPGPVGSPAEYALTTIAGGGSLAGDGVPATSASLYYPEGLLLDSSGMYIVQSNSHQIRHVAEDGLIRRYAGGGSVTGEEIDRLSAAMSYPIGIAADPAPGTYYYTDSTRVRRISGGKISTVAGTGVAGFGGDNGPAVSAQLSNAVGVAVDSAGNLYIADTGNGRVRRVADGVITTFAGGGAAMNDGADPTLAKLSPAGIALDSTGALYIADTYHSRIRKVSGGIIQTVAGGGSLSAEGSLATSASINPSGPIAIDATGSIYFAQSYSIKKIGPDGRIRTLTPSYSVSPHGITTDVLGNVYFTDSYNSYVVRKLTPAPAFCVYSVGVPQTAGASAGSVSIAITAPASCGWTASVDPSASWISVTAGQGSGDGSATIALAANTGPARSATVFVAGQAVTLTQAGMGTSAQFVKIDTTTRGSWMGKYGIDAYQIPNYGSFAPTPPYGTPAVSGAVSYNWDSGTTDLRALELPNSAMARFASVWYAANSFTIDLPFTDWNPHQFAVYCLDWDRLGRSQRLEILDAGGNVLDTRTVSAFGDGVYVVWDLSGPVRLRVTRITGTNAVISGMFFGGEGTLPVVVSIQPPSASLGPNQSQQFTAVVSAVNGAVTWSISPQVGSITQAGVYTAPASIASQQIVTVTATSQVDNTASSTRQVTLIPGPPAPSATAQFVRTDVTTQGNWAQSYGADGHLAAAVSGSDPSYVALSAPSGQYVHTWAANTTDVRALQQSSGSLRTAAVWYTTAALTTDLEMSGGSHQLAVYCLDWDNLGRVQTLQILDTKNNILDTRTIANFNTGVWLVWNVSGHVVLRVTRTAGPNAVLSGLFFGGAGALPVSVSVSPGTATLYGNQTQLFTAAVSNSSNTGVTWSIAPNTGSINSSGVYAAPSLVSSTQTVTVTATSQADPSKSASAIVTLQPSSGVAPSAQFVRFASTSGNWKGTYGGEGYALVGDATSNPAYVSPSYSGVSSHVWASGTSDVRALQQAAGASRTAGVWYAPVSMTVDLPFSDAAVHQVAVYCLDWDRLGRNQMLEILDAAGSVLDTRSVNDFGNGVWLVWNLKGHVKIRVTRIGGLNAVMSGLFFGPGASLPVSVTVTPASSSLYAGQIQGFTASVANASNTAVTWSISPNLGSISQTGFYTAPSSITVQQPVTITATSQADPSKSGTATVTLMLAPVTGSTAEFVRTDQNTRGTWLGVYGMDGYSIAGSVQSYPGYVTPALSGASTHVWAANTPELRALQYSVGRVAGVWYAPNSFVVNLPITDNLTHQVAAYFLDWDNLGRSQTVEVLDASNSVIDTRNISGFGGGTWLVWNVRGPVKLRVTKTGALNAVMSGVFFR